MTPCFADTFYFIAMLNERDPHHARVLDLNASMRRRLVTTSWVLTEVADAMARPPNRALFIRLLGLLRESDATSIIPFSEELFEAGFQLYSERKEKDWPITDCISFVVMRREGIVDALTGDLHFAQAGFNVLLA